MRLKVRYTYQSYWNVFLRARAWFRVEGGYQPIHQHKFHSLLICKTVVIIKKFVPYLDVMLLLLSKTITVDSPNYLQLEIFPFIRQDFSCFTNTEISSVLNKTKLRFLHFESFIKNITTDTTL